MRVLDTNAVYGSLSQYLSSSKYWTVFEIVVPFFSVTFAILVKLMFLQTQLLKSGSVQLYSCFCNVGLSLKEKNTSRLIDLFSGLTWIWTELLSEVAWNEWYWMYSSFPIGRTLKREKLTILESSRGINRLTGIVKIDVSIVWPVDPFVKERLVTADWTLALEVSHVKGFEVKDVI